MFHLTSITLRIDESVAPKVLPCRKVPIAIQDAVKEELDRLVNKGVLVWKAKWCKIQESKLSSHSTNFLSRSREVSIKLTKIKSRSTDFLSRSRHILIKLNNKN